MNATDEAESMAVEVKTSDGRFAPNYESPRIDRNDYISLDAGWLIVERTGGKTLRMEVVPNPTC